MVLIKVTGQVSMSRLTSLPEPLLECESRGANYFPRGKTINLYSNYILALLKGGGSKYPSVSPSNDGKGLIPRWYALNVCLVGPYIALASI